MCIYGDLDLALSCGVCLYGDLDLALICVACIYGDLDLALSCVVCIYGDLDLALSVVVQWRIQEFINGEGGTTNYKHIKHFERISLIV